MKMQSFVCNWPGQTEKVLKTEAQLAELGPVYVVNSGRDSKKINWIDIGEDAYFTDQFMTVLDNFDTNTYDALFHIQGDATYHDMPALFRDAEKYFDKYKCGIYAPNVDYTWYDSSRADITSLQCPDAGLKVVGCPDCTAWFIHKDVIDEFRQTKIDMSPYKMGWGWDLVLPAISYSMERPVIRDYNHTVAHPPGTNYNKDQAEREMAALFQAVPSNIRILMMMVKFNKEKLAGVFFDD